MDKVIPSRITEAREARAMSMGELASNIGVTTQSISKYERGITGPSPETLQAISFTLDFPISFFYKEEYAHTAQSSSLFFRSNSNIAKKVKNACTYQIKWASDIYKHLENYVDFVPLRLPTSDIDYEDLTLEDVEELAYCIRQEWGLGNDPISDLIGVLENHGIIVAQFSANSFCDFKGIEAFSSWKDGVPYILYHATQKSAVRTRFSLLHELGHLVMHSSISAQDAIKKDIINIADQQADRFAAAFLLPSSSFPKEVHSTALSSFKSIKERWGASISTIIKRCETLYILSEHQINYLKRQMTANKYWHKEPLDDVLIVDPPGMLRDAVYLLIKENILSKDYFLNVSSLSPHDLTCLCSLPDDFFDGSHQRSKPYLKLLDN